MGHLRSKKKREKAEEVRGAGQSSQHLAAQCRKISNFAFASQGGGTWAALASKTGKPSRFLLPPMSSLTQSDTDRSHGHTSESHGAKKRSFRDHFWFAVQIWGGLGESAPKLEIAELHPSPSR